MGVKIDGKGRSLGEMGSMSLKDGWLWLCGVKTAFSMTSLKFRVRHEPNEDRNMREIRVLSRLSII